MERIKKLDLQAVPIITFVFNRPSTTKTVIEAIQKQTKLPKEFYIFADGPRNDEDRLKLEEIKKIIKDISWVKVVPIFRDKNLGAAGNIIDGLNQIFSTYKKAVVIEDDVLVAPHFYEAMCILLDRYEGDKQVFSVGGYPSMLPRDLHQWKSDVVLSPRFSVWGWGTWQDRWKNLNCLQNKGLPVELEKIPSIAGQDVKGMMAEYCKRPDFFWDLKILHETLMKNQLHALTGYYLANNIGLNNGDHGNASFPAQEFSQKFNPVTDKIPNSFPETRFDRRITKFISNYLSSCGRFRKTPFNKLIINRGFMKSFLKKSRFYPILRKVYRWIFKKEDEKPNPSDYSTIVGIGTIVPCQIEAYFLVLNKYIEEKEKVLDVGFGLGYGLNIMAIKASSVNGIDVDQKVLNYCRDTVKGRNPRLDYLDVYDGKTLPFKNNEFDIVTCVDVLEHVEDFHSFLDELLRVSRKGVFISTPSRRPEYTNPDGTPKNYWHLREWSFEELDKILKKHGRVDWNFLNGPFDGPFSISKTIEPNTLTLSPFLHKKM